MHVGGGQTLLLSFASLAEVFVQRRSRETLVIFFTQAGKVATCVVGDWEAGKVATWWEGVVTFLHPQWLSHW